MYGRGCETSTELSHRTALCRLAVRAIFCRLRLRATVRLSHRRASPSISFEVFSTFKSKYAVFQTISVSSRHPSELLPPWVLAAFPLGSILVFPLPSLDFAPKLVKFEAFRFLLGGSEIYLRSEA